MWPVYRTGEHGVRGSAASLACSALAPACLCREHLGSLPAPPLDCFPGWGFWGALSPPCFVCLLLGSELQETWDTCFLTASWLSGGHRAGPQDLTQLRQGLGWVFPSPTNLLSTGKEATPFSVSGETLLPLDYLPTESSGLGSVGRIIHSFYLTCVQKARLDERPSICAFSVKTGSVFCVCFSCEGPWGASGGGVEGKAEHHAGNQLPCLPPCHPSPRGGKQSTQPETWLCSGRAGKAGSGREGRGEGAPEASRPWSGSRSHWPCGPQPPKAVTWRFCLWDSGSGQGHLSQDQLQGLIASREPQGRGWGRRGEERAQG